MTKVYASDYLYWIIYIKMKNLFQIILQFMIYETEF